MTPVDNLEELKQVPGYWYLASPYRNYAAGLNRACRDIQAISEALEKAGVRHWCPIMASHPWAVTMGVDPTDNKFWINKNWPFMGDACGMIIAAMDGWETSEGIVCERRVFHSAKKPIKILSLGLLGLTATERAAI